MTQSSKDAALIYSFGKAYNELKDNPHFQTYQEMVKVIINSLQNSLCDADPANSHELDFNTILTHRAGQVFGLKHVLIVQEQYHTNYLNSNKEDDDEDNEVPAPRSRSKRSRR